MRVLVVAATAFEVEKLMSEIGDQRLVAGDHRLAVAGQLGADNSLLTAHHSPLTIHYLITGVGMVATAFALGRHLAQNQYDLAINLGIAGCFDRSIALGELVEVTTDTISELGAEDDEQFISIDQLGFGESTFKATYPLPDDFRLKKVNSITVNTVHGNKESIQKISERVNTQLESMEGVAFFYACKQYNLPCMQIRAVSNYVEKRNRDNWQIGLAIKNLNNFALDFLNGLSVAD